MASVTVRVVDSAVKSFIVCFCHFRRQWLISTAKPLITGSNVVLTEKDLHHALTGKGSSGLGTATSRTESPHAAQLRRRLPHAQPFCGLLRTTVPSSSVTSMERESSRSMDPTQPAMIRVGILEPDTFAHAKTAQRPSVGCSAMTNRHDLVPRADPSVGMTQTSVGYTDAHAFTVLSWTSAAFTSSYSCIGSAFSLLGWTDSSAFFYDAEARNRLVELGWLV